MTKVLFEKHVREHEEALAGQMVHPLTGLDSFDPNAPDPDEEEMAMDEADQEESEEGSGENTGPVPMPELEGETAPPEGMVT